MPEPGRPPGARLQDVEAEGTASTPPASGSVTIPEPPAGRDAGDPEFKDEGLAGPTSEAEDHGSPAALRLKALEDVVGFRVIAYYASSASMGLWDSTPLAELLASMGRQRQLGFVLQSHGGTPETAHQMASLLREYADELHVYVPTFAHSAATLLVLGADVLWMGPQGELSPIDPQVPVDPKLLFPMADPKDWPNSQPVFIPAHVIRDFLELVGVLEGDPEIRMNRPKINQKGLEILMRQVNPWILGWYERAAKLSWVYGREGLTRYLLKGLQPDEQEKVTQSILRRLVDYYPSHETSLFRHRVRELGIPAEDFTDDIEEAIRPLNDWYERVLFPAGNIGRVLESTDGFHASPEKPEIPCPRCDEVLARDPDFRFCPNCGSALDTGCTKCQQPIESGWRHCPRCGAGVGRELK